MRPHEGKHGEGDDRKQCDGKKSRCPRCGRHSTAEVENPPDGERTDEAADVAEHGMYVAPRRDGSAVPAVPAVSDDESSQMMGP